MDLAENLKNICQCVRIDEPMKKHTTFKIGGNADIFCEPENTEELCGLIDFFKTEGIEYTVMGNGSNMLVSDKGIRGAVIKIGERMSNITVEGECIIAQSGALLSKIASVAKKNSLTGFEELAGIPGSLGGAVYMNAGAYGGETAAVVEEVNFITSSGEIRTAKAEELDFGYRHSVFTNGSDIILSAKIRLKKGNTAEIEEKMKDYSKRRSDKQPLNYPSAGSVFKRPQGYFAGKLIEDCGLKGKTIGGAQISEKHAGFIINRSDATARDVLALIEYAQNEVMEKFGVKIEPEIRLTGEE